MPKAKIRTGRQEGELADVIITAWLRAVPDTAGGGGVQWPPNADTLSAAFNSILDPDDARCVAIPELAPVVVDGKKIYTIFIPVPYPPRDNKVDLIDYLHTSEAGDHTKFGHALIFACGR